MRYLLTLVFLGACLPTGGPPTGMASGTLQGQLIDVVLDEDSDFYLLRKTTCVMLDQSIFSLRYGAATLVVNFQIDGGPSAFADRTYDIPSAMPSSLVWFGVAPTQVASATLKVGISGLLGRRSGEFHLVFGDGGTIDGTFDMPFDVHGERVSCGGGGGDDWD